MSIMLARVAQSSIVKTLFTLCQECRETHKIKQASEKSASLFYYKV
jgi:hypothetical protein